MKIRMSKEKGYFILFVAILAIVFGSAYRPLYHWRQYVQDVGIWVHPTFAETNNNFFYAWNNKYLGRYGPTLPGLFVLEVLAHFVSGLVGGIPSAMPRIFHLSLLPMSSITMYILLHRFVRHTFTRFLCSLVYAINFFTIPNFLVGDPVLVAHVSFPLLVLILIKVIEQKGSRLLNIVKLATIFAFTWSFVYLAPTLFMPFIIILPLVEILDRKDWKYAYKTISTLLISIGVAFLLSAPFSFHLIRSLISYYSSPAGGYGFTGPLPQKFLIDVFIWWFKWEAYYPLGAILVALAPMALIIHEWARQKRFLSFMIISVSCLLFWVMASNGWVTSLLPILPVLHSLRPSWMIYIIIWSLLMMTATAVDEVACKLYASMHALGKLQKHASTGYAFIMIGLIVWIPFLTIFNYGYVNDDLADPYRNTLHFFSLKTDEVFIRQWQGAGSEVPPVIDEVRNWLDDRSKSEGYFRTLWVPSDHRLHWNVFFYYDPQTLTPVADVNYTKWILNMLINKATNHTGELLGLANVKYIIVADFRLTEWNFKDVPKWGVIGWYDGPPRLDDYGFSGSYAVGDPKSYVEILDEQTDLKKIVNREDLIIYENLKFRPHVSIHDNLFIMAPKEIIGVSPLYTRDMYARNLLTNPSFEKGVNNWLVDFRLADDANYVIDNSTYHSASELENSSLRIELPSQEPAEYYGRVLQSVDIEGASYYYLSVFVKGTNMWEVFVELEFYSASDEYLGKQNIHLNPEQIKDWQNAEIYTKSPPNATRAIIILVVATGSVDGVAPGAAWFDDILFLHGFMRAPSKFLDFFPYFRIGDFSPQWQPLVVTPDILEQNITALDISMADVVLFPGDVLESDQTAKWINESKALLYVSQGRSSLLSIKGEWKIIENSQLSDGLGLSCLGEGESIKYFYAPKLGYYTFAVASIGERIHLGIDNQTLDLTHEKIGNFSWYESKSVYLEEGHHILSINTTDPVIIDQIFILQTLDGETKIKNLLLPTQTTTLHSKMISPVEYDVWIETERPVYIVLGDSYDMDWNAYANGTKLRHFPAHHFGWANGFYLEGTGKYHVKIFYEKQHMRNIEICVWSITWHFSITAIVVSLLSNTLKNCLADIKRLVKRILLTALRRRNRQDDV